MEGLINLRISETALLRVTERSPRYKTFAEARAELLRLAAIRIFRQREVQVGSVSSATSPPVYIESFRVTWSGGKLMLINIDPGALWVEFGARAGGITEVLKYRPMGLAIDLVAAGGMDG